MHMDHNKDVNMKPMTELPMDTSGSSCGGPPVLTETRCPRCGEKGRHVKSGTVRYLLNKEYKHDVTDKAYGLCLTSDCDIAWYAQDGSHHFTTGQAGTSIWTKNDTDPVMACYCNEITRQMVFDAVRNEELHDMQSIIIHYRGDIQSKCAVRNPEGRCCTEAFNSMINEAMAA